MLDDNLTEQRKLKKLVNGVFEDSLNLVANFLSKISSVDLNIYEEENIPAAHIEGDKDRLTFKKTPTKGDATRLKIYPADIINILKEISEYLRDNLANRASNELKTKQVEIANIIRENSDKKINEHQSSEQTEATEKLERIEEKKNELISNINSAIDKIKALLSTAKIKPGNTKVKISGEENLNTTNNLTAISNVASSLILIFKASIEIHDELEKLSIALITNLDPEENLPEKPEDPDPPSGKPGGDDPDSDGDKTGSGGDPGEDPTIPQKPPTQPIPQPEQDLVPPPEDLSIINRSALNTEAARLVSILGQQQNLWGVKLFGDNVPPLVQERLRGEITDKVQALLLSLNKEQQKELITNPARRIEYLNRLMFQLMPTAILVGNSDLPTSQFHADIAEAIHETYNNASDSDKLEIERILNRSNEPGFLPEVLKKISQVDDLENRFAPVSVESAVDYYDKDFEETFEKGLSGVAQLDSDVKLQLAKTNIDFAVKALAELGYPPELIYNTQTGDIGLSEDKFKLIFGSDIPYTPEFASYLRDYSLIYNIKNANRFNKSNLSLHDTKTVNESNQKDFKENHLNKINRTKKSLHRDELIKQSGDQEQTDTKPKKINKTNKQIWDGLKKEEQISILQASGLLPRTDNEVSEQQIITLSQDVEISVFVEYSIAQQEPGVAPQQIYYSDGSGLNNIGIQGDPDQSLNPGSPHYYASHPAANIGKLVKGEAGKYLKGKAKDKFKKEAGKFVAKKLGTKAATAAAGAAMSGGTSLLLQAGMELATNKKLQKALIIGGLTVPPALIAVISQVGAVGGAAMGAVVGTMIGIGPVFGAMAGGALGNLGTGGNLFGIKSMFSGGSGGSSAASSFMGGASKAMGQGVNNAFGQGSQAASQSLQSTLTGSQASSASSASAANAAAVKSTFATTATTVVANPAAAAVLSTVGIVSIASFFGFMTVQNALLADFSHVVPLGTSDSEGKISRFVTVKKEVYIPGCPDQQCDGGNFPFEAEYTITITPKEDFVITIKDINDVIKANHNEEHYEEIGEKVPSLTSEEESTHAKDIASFSADISEGQVLNPGEEIVIKYRQTFSENYNHASVRNTVTLDFSYDNGDESGTDDAITGEFICIGECPAGLGCWPASGTITQLPYGDYSHDDPLLDAFDIINDLGTPVYSPFAGELCAPAKCTDKIGYGCYVDLKTKVDGESIVLRIAHFEEHPLGLNPEDNDPTNDCIQVKDGTYIGPMGNRGRSSTPHIHYELRGNNSKPSKLVNYVPDGNDVQKQDPVRSCYDQ